MKAKYSILLLVSLLSFSACENFLQTEPTDFLSPSNYYQTEQHLEFARAGVYDRLGTDALYGSYANYLLAWNADEGYMNRSTLTTGPWNYNFSSADKYNTEFWSNLYDGINRANVLLANVDRNPDIDQKVRDVIRGETLFLRGYFYFMLVQHFGGVPIRTEPTLSVDAVDIPRATIEEVYQQILSDMTAAEPLVPGIEKIGNAGSVSKSAVRGLLARVNLTMAGSPLKDESRYAEAKKWAKMVMDDSSAGHALNPSYPQIFMNMAGDRYDIMESIWEIEFWGNMNDSFVETGNQGFHNGPKSNAGSATGRADAYMSTTAQLYNVYEPGDLRKWFCIAHFKYLNTNINGDKVLKDVASNEFQKYKYEPGKWRREYETLQPKGLRTPQNVPILRYTDVMMMYAEAENALNGPTAEAVETINKIRRRSWSKGVKRIAITNPGSGYTSAPTVTFAGGGGSGAQATAVIDASGQVKAIELERDQAGITYFTEGVYTSVPSITLAGGGGSGAMAEAEINTPADADLKPEQTASKAQFLRLIQDERLREFNFEGLRKTDLLRWGIFLEVNQDMGNTLQMDAPGSFFQKYYTNVSPKNLFSPIPASEMTVNIAMKQNPGWD